MCKQENVLKNVAKEGINAAVYNYLYSRDVLVYFEETVGQWNDRDIMKLKMTLIIYEFFSLQLQ
jgi:hypothetical protein